jgi:hypothetical protein
MFRNFIGGNALTLGIGIDCWVKAIPNEMIHSCHQDDIKLQVQTS